MSAPATDLLVELEPVVAQQLDRHLSVAKEWMPQDYVPWSRGRDFTTDPWDASQSTLSEVAQVAFEVNLLTEDNLPSYHHELASRFGRDGAWGTWVGRWTAEEGRHAYCMRDFLLVSRGVNPVDLERARMAVMQAGYITDDKAPLNVLAYVSFQELATRIAHRNTGRYTEDVDAERLLARVAADENLHMIFYRELVSAALEIDPSATVRAIADEVIGFQMPGTGIPDFGRKAVMIANAQIYDLRIHHDDVIWPLLRQWGYFERTGLDAEAQAAQAKLQKFLGKLDTAATQMAAKRDELLATTSS
jgi:acyl-[acyl-carrier-protein] desaturase